MPDFCPINYLRMPGESPLLLKETLCGFHEHGGADRHGALINIEPRVMEEIFLMSLLLGARREHGYRVMLQEFSEILCTQCCFNFLHVFGAEHILSGFFNDIRNHFVVDHWRTTDLESDFVITAKSFCHIEGTPDLRMDLPLDVWIRESQSPGQL